MFRVSLINKDGAVFDKGEEKSLLDALKFASCRGQDYNVHISTGDPDNEEEGWRGYEIPVTSSSKSMSFVIKIMSRYSDKERFITMDEDNYIGFTEKLFKCYNEWGTTGYDEIYNSPDPVAVYNRLLKS